MNNNGIWEKLNKDISFNKKPKQKKALSAWNREDRTPVKLCKGAEIDEAVYDISEILFNIVILATAIICAMLYHSFKSENLGYLGFFSIYAITMFLFRDYINSGFYAVLNDTIDWASIYFNAEGFQYYNERISNRYAAVTISMSIIGVAMNVLLNNYILRRARYMIAIGLSLTFNVVIMV